MNYISVYSSGSSWPKSALCYISNVLLETSWAEQQAGICIVIAYAKKVGQIEPQICLLIGILRGYLLLAVLYN